MEKSIWIDKTEQQMFSEQWREKFETCDETGAYLFTTTGCFNRNNRERAQQELSLRENKIVSFDYYRTDEIQENLLVAYVAELQARHIPIKEKTLEMYVLKHINILDGVKEIFIDYLTSAIID